MGIIQKLDSNYLVKIMKRNIVGTILIFSALVWIPASCFISWVDRKQEEEEREEWEWYMQEHFVPASLAEGVGTKKLVGKPKAGAAAAAAAAAAGVDGKSTPVV